MSFPTSDMNRARLRIIQSDSNSYVMHFVYEGGCLRNPYVYRLAGVVDQHPTAHRVVLQLGDVEIVHPLVHFV